MILREDLIELREIFRVRFKTHDFCIGEGEVEELFREMLGEPKPEEIHYDSPKDGIKLDEINSIMNDIFNKDKVEAIFESSSLYKLIKK